MLPTKILPTSDQTILYHYSRRRIFREVLGCSGGLCSLVVDQKDPCTIKPSIIAQICMYRR